MRTLSWILLTASLAAAGPAAAADARVRIELLAAVGLARADVTLGDIAALTSDDLAIVRRLAELPLGPAPRAGEQARLTREQVVRWIASRTGIAAGAIQWEGAVATELQRASQEIPAERLSAAAEESLRAWVAARSSRAEITLASLPRDLPVPIGQSTLRVRAIPQEATLARRVLVWVDVWVDERFIRTVPVGFEVSAFAPAYVATGALQAGASLDDRSVALREVQVAGRAAPLLQPVSLESPKQLRRPLDSGAVLKAADVQAAPAVTRGDWVALRVRSGGIELESRVEALQSGHVGQSVSVKAAKAASPMLARVVGPGEVEAMQ